MNVLQILPELNAGGVERTTIEVADALVSAGHTAHVASAGGAMVNELTAAGARHHTLPLATKNPFRWAGNAARLGHIIADHDIHLVHARSRAPAFAAKAAAKRAGAPFVTTYHGIYNANGPLKRSYNSVMASGDIIIANSLYTRDHIIAQHGTDPARIRVIPRGVDMIRFDPARSLDTVAQRAAWGVPADAPLWLVPGRITQWKGQGTAIAALAYHPAAHLVLLGRVQGAGTYHAQLLAQAEGFPGRVHVIDHTDDMPTAYAASDVVLSPSTDPEAFGRVAAEAQAMGRPVVATAHGGSLETVEDGVTGRLVPPGDASALAAAITDVLSRPYDGPYARARILAQFSDTRMKQAVLAVYAELVRA